MSLYQLMISRDNSWDIMNELLELDFCHYIPLNDHKEKKDLLYTDILERTKAISNKIQFIESMYKAYAVPMRAPGDYAQLEDAIKNIAEE